MRVYIIRHGEAALPEHGERALTAHGVEQARRAGELLAAEGVDHLLYSPKLRTRQTCEHIVDVVGGVAATEASCLLPPAAIHEVVSAIEQAGVSRLALVSHLPWVAEMVGWFVNGDMRDYRLTGFPTSGVVALDMETVGQGLAQIAWHAFPPGYELLS